MQAKCYDCKKLIPEAEAVKQKEGGGNITGGGYSKWGLGLGTGNWQNKSRSFSLCIECAHRREERENFWRLVINIIFLVVTIVTFASAFFQNTRM
ncbi:hypothetical protein [endosymbiont GvMRE of Glomus versiforme]|uniref:hypothetical protein n=1 Tax=endosymbiont GvMRE of Glomus versiforme TaxID=2039283 RepID=UPI000EE2550E|nr:hypothetical protein [endosymbiont GvMRE of Glomus versiforme]RHZ35629.1 hypothetical protein GvMRE_IIg164 [endosymbiont GvMRE of Glomus versiforme]